MLGNKRQTNLDDAPKEELGYDKARWLSFKGRLGRVRFTCYFLLIVLPLIAAFDFLQLLTKTHKPGLLDALLQAPYMPWAIIVLAALVILPLVIQRLHDFGWPAWYSASLLIPFVNLLVLVHLFTGSGQAKTNDYGAVPEPNKSATWMLFGFLMGMPFLYFYKILKTYLLFFLITVY